ncbi:GVINP1 [Symbiodinium sp. KB8]|nr:GVINP1 [Symbiodinium sp. KB8]
MICLGNLEAEAPFSVVLAASLAAVPFLTWHRALWSDLHEALRGLPVRSTALAATVMVTVMLMRQVFVDELFSQLHEAVNIAQDWEEAAQRAVAALGVFCSSLPFLIWSFAAAFPQVTRAALFGTVSLSMAGLALAGLPRPLTFAKVTRAALFSTVSLSMAGLALAGLPRRMHVSFRNLMQRLALSKIRKRLPRATGRVATAVAALGVISFVAFRAELIAEPRWLALCAGACLIPAKIFLWPRRDAQATATVPALPAFPRLEERISLESLRLLEPASETQLEEVVEEFDGSQSSWTSLAKLLCQMAKVGYPWDSLLENLREQNPNLFPETTTCNSLFLWLLSVLDKDAKRILVTERMKQHSVPLSTAWPEKRHCSELLWSMPQTPVLMSLKLSDGACGVSTLLNKVFGTDFELSGSSHGENLQLHAGLNTTNPGRGFAVVDMHGKATAVPESICLASSFVMFHTTANDLENARRTIRCLIDKKPRWLGVYVLVQSNGCEAVRQESASEGGALVSVAVGIFHIPQKKSLQKKCRPSLKKMLYKELKTRMPQSPRSLDAFSYLSALFNFMDEEEPALWQQMRSIASTCAAACADTAMEREVFPMACAYKEHCEVERKMKDAEKKDDRHEANKLKQRRDELARERSDTSPSPVANQFVGVLVSENSEVQLEQLQRIMLCEFQQKNMSQVQAQITMAQLHREVIQLICHSKQMSQNECERVQKAYADLIWKGMPFELLDGDNLHLPMSFLKKIFEELQPHMTGKHFEVLSTTGPQSSGKSTLNNCFYGSRFGVSEGRCSRGVFAEFHRTEDTIALVLDTEGLQSAERADPEFDRLMMLFTLAVSNRVDVVVKGMMTEPFKKLIEVCVRAWKHLQVAKVPEPRISWMMNQVADQNPKHHEDSFSQMFEELKLVFKPEEEAAVRKFLRLDELHKLSLTVFPSRFNEKVFVKHGVKERWTQLSINENFSRKCAEATATKLADISARKHAADHMEGPTQWLDMAQAVFHTITSYADLTYYEDIRHIELEKKMQEWISDQMRQLFREPNIRDKLAEQRQKIQESQDTWTFEAHRRQLYDLFQTAKGNVAERLDKELKLAKANENFRQRLSKNLNAELEAEFDHWCSEATQKGLEKSVRQAIARGDERLLTEVQHLLRNPNEVSSRQEAEDAFEQVWQKIVQEMKNTFNREEGKLKLFMRIYKFYPIAYKPEESEVRARSEKDDFTCSDKELFLESAYNDAGFLSSFEAVAGLATVLMKPLSKRKEHWNATVRQVRGMVVQKCCEDGFRPNQLNMHKICDVVDDEAQKLDSLLRAEFQCELSRKGRGCLIALAIIETWRSVEEAVWNDGMREINKFEEQKDDQCKFFCSQVLQDRTADQQLARRWVQGIIKNQKDQCIDDLCKQFEEVLQKEQDKLTRKAVQDELDSCLGSDDLDRQEKYILDPISAILAEFETKWGSIVEGKVDYQLIKESLRHLGYLRDALAELRDKHGLQAENASSSQLLEVTEDFAVTVTDSQRAKNQGLGAWLLAYLTQEVLLPSKWARADDGTLETCDQTASAQIELPQNQNRLPLKGSPVMSEDLRKQLQAQPALAIDNLNTFLNAAIEELESHLKVIDAEVRSEVGKRKGERKNVLKDELIPCPAKCPCCGRLCSNPTPGHTTHSCHGHLPRGFIGRHVQDGNKTASTIMCTEMKDTSVLEDENGKVMEWQEYKKNHPSWNFGDKDPGRTDFEARALRAWRKVGPRFCKRYGTRFTEHGEASSSVNGPPTHWLLILDSSPSMVGEPWLGLKEAVKALLLKLEGAKQDRFTIIQFSGTAWIEMTYEANPIVQEAFESVAPRGGYTSFQAGLECARDAVLKLAERHTGRTTAVFMSDGCDGPRDGSKMSTSTMDDFRKALEEHSTDFQFHSIAYGGHADEAQLKIMADVVGGKFSKSEDEVELKSAFVELAPLATA